MRRIAAIGDIHGELEQLKALYESLCWIGLDEIVSLGDAVDRGPDSGGCVRFLREHGIKMIMGNHESSVLNLRAKGLRGSEDKNRTIDSLTPEDWEYLETAPSYRYYQDLNSVLVHGGLWPNLPLEKQPKNIIRAQMIHPDKPTRIRWWGPSAAKGRDGKTEEESRAEGWDRWYRIYNLPFDVYYGHSVFAAPHVQRNPGAGLSCGIDTGGVFGGSLTAAIISGGEPRFMSVKAKSVYAQLTERSLWEQ
jgi:predicted phosphodiesterase